MQSAYDKKEIRSLINEMITEELHAKLSDNLFVQSFALEVAKHTFADRKKTEDRYDRMFEELKKDREESRRKWEEHLQRYDKDQEEHNRRWDEHLQRYDKDQEEHNRKWEESNRKWDEHLQRYDKDQEEHNRKWDEHLQRYDKNQEEHNRKWEEHLQRYDKDQEEHNRKWEESNRRWDEHLVKDNERRKEVDERIEKLYKEIKVLYHKHDSTIGALGARWGGASETAFRSGLRGILEDRFNVQVKNVNEYDSQGFVFGHPDQVEIDIIIINKEIIACEIKSSMSPSDMYTFHRKVQFYENKHSCKVKTIMVISPMVDDRARAVANKLGINVYSYPENVQNI